MKTRRLQPPFKITARRITAGLICMFTMISMMNIVLPVSAASDMPEMDYIIRAWHSDGTYREMSSYIYMNDEGNYVTNEGIKPDEETGILEITPGDFEGFAGEEFVGFSVSAGQSAVTIDNDTNTLQIKYDPNVHLVKAHAFFKSSDIFVAGSSDEAVYGGTDSLEKDDQDTAAAWGYPVGTTEITTNADLSKTPITDEDKKYIMKSVDEATARARVSERLGKNEIKIDGVAGDSDIDWETTPLTDAKVYKTTEGLHTDKTASVLNEDERTYQLDLESWFVGNNKADVGLILDASGSMAFSSEGDADGNKTFTKITQSDGKMFEERTGKSGDAALEEVEVKIDSASVSGSEMSESGKLLSDNEVNTILKDKANPSEEEHGTINPNKNTDNSALSYTGYNYYIFDKRSGTNEYVPIGYWDGTDDSLHYTGVVDTDEGMPGFDNLLSYYDFQKDVTLEEGHTRSWTVNRRRHEHAQAVDSVEVNGGEFNFGIAEDTETDTQGLEFSEANGLNVSYKKGNIVQDKGLILGGELGDNFTVSFNIRSSQKEGQDESSKLSSKKTDQLIYIGPLENNSGSEFVNVWRAADGSTERLKIGHGLSSSLPEQGNLYNEKKFKNIIQSKETITYTLVFTKTEDNKEHVQVYENGVVPSSPEHATSGDVEKTKTWRVVLNGIKDNYDGQDLYVDNVYIFNKALEPTDVETLYNTYQNNSDITEKNPSDDQKKTQAQPWTIKPSSTVTDKGLPYFTVGESKSATARLDDNIGDTSAAKRAGWYYVTSDSQWENITKLGTAKYMHALRTNVGDKKRYYYNGYEPSEAGLPNEEGKLNDEIEKEINEGKEDGKYYYYEPKEYEPLKFFLDDKGHLCCFYSTGNDKMESNGWSHVYVKKNATRIKSEVLQHALGMFATNLDEASPDSRISAVRFSTQRYTTSGDDGTFDATKHSDEYARFKLLGWTEDANAAVSVLNRDRGSVGVDGVLANSDGLYNYVLTGNTSTAAGFRTFNDCLAEDAYPNTKKYLIVFTDGKDSELSKALENEENNIDDLLDPTGEKALEAVKAAQQLREDGYTILCVMLSGGTVARGSSDYKQAIQFLAAIAGETYVENKIPANYDPKEYDSSTPQYKNIFEGHTSDEVTEAFSEDIVGRIADNLDQYTVKDYIDPRFNLVDSDGRLWKLEKDGKVTIGDDEDADLSAEEYKDITLRGRDSKMEGWAAQLHYDKDKNMYYLEWDAATIPGCSKGVSTLGVWNAQITVKAKDDFIGGNAVITNGNVELENYLYHTDDAESASSGFDDAQRVKEGDEVTKYPSKGFPRTTVNVKIPKPEITEGRQVLFMGEKLTNEGVAEKLGESIRDKWLEDTENAWYWNYLKRYAEYQNKLGNPKYTPADPSKTPFDMLIDEIVATASAGASVSYDYYYIPDIDDANTQTGADKGKHENDMLGTLTFSWKDVAGEGTGYSAYPEDGITADTDSRHSELTFTYTPVGSADRGDNNEVVTDGNYGWDKGFKPAAGSEQNTTGEITGPYTTNIVSGEIAFEMILPSEVAAYLQTYAPGQTVTYTAKLVKKGETDAIGTYTAEYKVPSVPDTTPAEVKIPVSIEYSSDFNGAYGLSLGEYEVVPVSGKGFGIKFGDITEGALADSQAGTFKTFSNNNTKTADEILDPPTEAVTHTIGDFAADITGGAVTIGGKREGEEATKYLDRRYAMAAVSASIDKMALSISKTVVNAPASDADKAFKFNITLGNVNETYDYEGDPTTVNDAAPTTDKKIKFTDGLATVELKNAESITIKNIPTDTAYTVSEADDDDYTKTVTGSESGTISDAVDNAVAYTNTYKTQMPPNPPEPPEPPKTGSLTLSKTVVNAPASDADKAFRFNITLGNVNETYDYEGDPTTVNDAAPTTDKKIKFTDGKATVTLKHNETITIKDIAENTAYTVSEADDDDYTKTVTGSESDTISDAVESKAAYTNTYITQMPPNPPEPPEPPKTGSLTVSKTVTGDDAPANAEFDFTITLEGAENAEYSYDGDPTTVNGAAPTADKKIKFTDGAAAVKLKSGEKITIDGIDVDTKYTVKETAVKNYTASVTGGTLKQGVVNGSIVEDGSTVAYTNKYTKPMPTPEPTKSPSKHSSRPRPTAAPTPTATPTPTASPKPNGDQSTSSPSPSPTPAPTSSPKPTPTPEPTPVPTPVPTPTPEPIPTPEPVPTEPPRYTDGESGGTTPQTGDNNMPALWMAAAVVFGCGAVASLKRLKKKRNQ